MNKKDLIDLSKHLHVLYINTKYKPNDKNEYELDCVPIKYGINITFQIHSLSNLEFTEKINDYYYDVDKMILKLNNYKPKNSEEMIEVIYYGLLYIK